MILEKSIDQELSKKTRREGWSRYQDHHGELVDLPDEWIEVLEGSKFAPAPRCQFSAVLAKLEVGQPIMLPSIGQPPTHFDGNGNGNGTSIVVTDQMLGLWKQIQGPQKRVYRCVLAGPMGIGKSYLSYFLAANAYAAHWLTLYIADTGALQPEEKSASEIIFRFIAINKDIHTDKDYRTMLFYFNEQSSLSKQALAAIFGL